ncbi:hypothetical protein MGYG_05938 [Nannizzia gypsea CBS 118893]|uniref:Uncharacterized protein n=1 Tax=Arthroderma gypseum (strain ATCC MYA-4604 / CBS 118893) TaxID=535722 RepID=E4V001_ARTGP|nr:hypothetical protein MGYG_05938 [Nannizzia gypsea CBS 118893]EFR02938.1 hypothetical protein MGYG_05938 [Nannizzia gypsea CBS 118893]
MTNLLSPFATLLQMAWPPNREASRPTNGTIHMFPGATPDSLEQIEESSSGDEDIYQDSDNETVPETQVNRGTLMERIPGISTLLRTVIIWSQPSQASREPRPQFYITRPTGTKVPLIPLDELPAGLKIGRQNWYSHLWPRRMTPVSEFRVRHAGEYEVTIRSGTQFKRKRFSVSRGQSDKQDGSEPLLDCCTCSTVKNLTEGTEGLSRFQGNWRNPTQSLLLPQRGQNNQRYGTFSPQSSLIMDLSEASNVDSKDTAAETGGTGFQSGQGREPPRQAFDLLLDDAPSDLSRSVLWELDGTVVPRNDRPDAPADTNAIPQSRSNSTRFMNYPLYQLSERLRMSRIQEPDETLD